MSTERGAQQSIPPRARPPVSADHSGDGWADAVDEPLFKPLSAEEARQWRERHPAPSVWRVVVWQAGLTGLAVAMAAALVGLWWPGRWAWVASVAYGGLSALLPTAVMAWGLTSSALARWLRVAAPGVARASLAGWLWWEGIKVLLVLAMLWTAPRWIPDLSWPGLVVGLVVALKSYWLAWITPRAARG